MTTHKKAVLASILFILGTLGVMVLIAWAGIVLSGPFFEWAATLLRGW